MIAIKTTIVVIIILFVEKFLLKTFSNKFAIKNIDIIFAISENQLNITVYFQNLYKTSLIIKELQDINMNLR